MMIPRPASSRSGLRFAALGTCAFALALTGQAFAQQGPLGPVLECADIQDNAERLACYDERVGNLRTSVRTGEVVAVDRPAVEAIERDGFGFNLPSLPRLSLSLFSGGGEDGSATASTSRSLGVDAGSESVEVVERREDGQVERVLMTIARADMVSPNQYRFTMENGQVWVQEGAGRRISTRGIAGTQADIRRGSMGAYTMRLDGAGQVLRVNRVR